jgi:outer membrane protein insertion porin family
VVVSKSARRSPRSNSSGSRNSKGRPQERPAEVGLAESRIFDRAVLERAEQELKRQYLTRGNYAVQVTTTVTPLERNRVGINFNIDEGEIAKIRQINIVGAKAFGKDLLDLMVQLTRRAG